MPDHLSLPQPTNCSTKPHMGALGYMALALDTAPTDGFWTVIDRLPEVQRPAIMERLRTVAKMCVTTYYDKHGETKSIALFSLAILEDKKHKGVSINPKRVKP